MKARIASELISVVVIGGLAGLYSHASKLKWRRLGRDAFLSDKPHYFDKVIANPSAAINSIVIFVVLGVLIFVLYKSLALGLERLFCSVFEENNTGGEFTAPSAPIAAGPALSVTAT